MNDDDRRVADAEWKGEVTQILKAQNETLSRIEKHCETTNGRVSSLEKSRDKNAWLMKALGVIGLGGAVKAFSN